MIESDLDLLRKYSREGSEAAFAEVVRRHVDLVFSVALRKVRSQHLAEEVAQSAFLDLARSIHRLKPDTVVSAWLYQVAHRTAVDAVRRETRREAREQIAANMSALDCSTDSVQPDWGQIEPLLDDEMAGLPEADRVAIVLRFFEGKSFSDVGRAIGLSDDAAQKRVSRALEKLRGGLQRRGVTVGAGALLTLISTQAVQAAPVGLASSVVAAVASATLAGGGVAVVAAKAVAMGTVQKTAIALAAVATIGVAGYQTHKSHRLERELAAMRERVAAGPETLAEGGAGTAGAAVAPERSSKPELESLNAAWAGLQAERDRLIAQRDAAERLARMYKEVASSREAVAATNVFPTARHVTAARGRLMRRSVLLQEASKDKRQEPLSPEEEEAMTSGAVAMMREVTLLAEAELRFSSRMQEPKDPVDDLTVFAFGALDLDERQFRQVYGLLRELENDAARLGPIGRDPSEEERAALKALKAGGEEKLKALLTPEQQRWFQLLEPYLPLVRPQPGR